MFSGLTELEAAAPLDLVARWRRVWTHVWLSTSIASAFWIVWTSRDDLALLADASLWLIVAMTTMHAVSIMTQSDRFRIVLNQHGKRDVRIGAWTRVYVRGRLYSTLVPQSGHIYRGLALKQDHDMAPIRYLSSLATQTWLALVAGLFFAIAITALTLLGEHDASASSAVRGLIVALIVVVVTPIVVTRFSSSLPERLRQRRIARLAGEVLGLAGKTARSPGVVAAFLVYVLVGLLAGGLGMAIAFAVAGEEITWATGIAVLAFVNLGNVVSITPANLGVQELGVAALAALFDYSPAAGVVGSVVVRLSNIVALTALLLIFESEKLIVRRAGIH